MDVQLNSCLTAYENVKTGEVFVFRDVVYFRICDSGTYASIGVREHVTAIRLSDTAPYHFTAETQVRVIQGKFVENA